MRRRPPKARGSAVVRRVLEVTLEELARVGVARLSLPRVAELAAINKTSLYRRWPTKEALVAAALGLAVPVESELPDHGDVESDLADLACGLASFIASPAGMGVVRTVFADGDTPLARQLGAAMRSGPSQRTPRLVVERAIARGELREDTDLDLLLHTIAGAVLHRIFVERRAADRPWARRLVSLITAGSRKRRSRG